ncbi:MAG: DUF3135 domain-containing protein [Candidatus Yonathbacteria bacterium]|nr:DUF3135 domain-containing protein [Candidatus Yonathbacteria bacterium]
MRALCKITVSSRYDYLFKLYKSDPKEFERHTRAMIEAQIQNAPPHLQLKLRALQSLLYTELSHYKHPLARMNRMVELFWEKAIELQSALNGSLQKKVSKSKGQDAKVIALFKKD